MKTKLTPDFVKMATADPACAGFQAKPDAERTIYWDTAMPGFGLMVTAKRAKSYVVQYRIGRVSRRMTIDGILDLSKARKRAKGLLGEVAQGGDPLADKRKTEAAAGNLLKAIAENYLAREGKNLRSLKNRESIFRRNIFPAFGTIPIGAIRRSDITKLLDKVDDECGPTAADETLATLRKLMSWHASRSDDFRSPIVRGMARTNPTERARTRVLDDEELRAVWKAATATDGPYGALVRFLLLTAARRDEAREMPWSELVDGVWTIPADRNKTKKYDVVLPLSNAAQTLLAKVPVLGHFVFSINGRNPIGGLSGHKIEFDRLSGVTGWRIHDTRRTARSLMSRAGVDHDIAERCLGHVIRGVRGVYDRHAYLDEKRFAFEKLAALFEGIVNPKPTVLPFAKVSGETRK
jgi:integrase